MRIVTDGTKFAIEKGWIFKKYLDTHSPQFWWSRKDDYYLYCWASEQRIIDLCLHLNKNKNIVRAYSVESKVDEILNFSTGCRCCQKS